MLTAFAAVMAAAGSAAYADTAAEVASRCGACHQLQAPAKTSLKERAERKGPPLYYAGNKFRRQWLINWMQKPVRIRPAGDFPAAHVKTSAHGDVVDTQTLTAHPVLDAATAQRFADWLMTLTPKSALVAAEAYKPGHVSKRFGAMNFGKFKGCGACHEDAPKHGGLSGPELYSAWQRLQPGFIASYIRNPVAWEPFSLMPVKHLQSPQAYKLMDYLRVIGEEGKQK